MRPIAKLLILFTLFSSTSVSAQDSKNGATWYRKAIKAYNALPRDLRESILNWNWADTTTPISDEMRLAIARIQPILRLTWRGASQEHSDFNLPYEDGVEMRLPYLQPMRGITMLAMADITIRIRDGDSATAAAQLASMYRLSSHYSSDRMIISSLIGNATFIFTDTIAQTGFDSAAFDEVDCATMMEALNAFSDKDPFDFVEAMTTEREVMNEWLADKFASQEDGQAIQSDDLMWLSSDAQVRDDLAAITPDEFTEILDYADSVTNRVVEAFMNPNKEAARAALDEISQEIENSDHAELATLLFPAYDRIFEGMQIAVQKLAARKAALALLITRKVEPKQGANAVVWYFRAITLLKEIEQEKRDQWEILAIDADKPIDEEMEKTFVEAESLISIVREASQMTRCDFAAAIRNEIVTLPAYLPGFRELGNLLIADANRLFELGEADAAFDRLSICLRMSAHLAKDKTIASALVSHKIFTLASAILQKPLTKAFLDDVHRVLIEEALDMMGRKDPFGYIAAIIVSRKDVENWFWAKSLGASAEDKTLLKCISNCQIDRLFTLTVMKWRGPERTFEWPVAAIDTLGPISDVINLDAIAEAILQTPQLNEAAREKQYASIFEKDRPVISPVRQQLARARGDFRKAVLALKD